MRFALLLCFLALTSLSVNAQNPTPSPLDTPPLRVSESEEPDVLRVTTNLIQIDAVVTDKSGKFVSNLRPEDLEILVNGKHQAITNFSFVKIESELPKSDAPRKANASAGPTTPVRLRPDQVKRTIALVVDDLGMDCSNTSFVRQTLKSFVDLQMQSGDLVAIIRTGSGVGVLQQFTSDKRQLYAAVERVKYYPAVGKCLGMTPTPRSDEDKQRERLLPKEDASVKAAEDIDEFRENIRFDSTLGAVDYVVRGMAGLPGRKGLVLLSEGFPIDRTHVRDRIRRLADDANRAGVVIYTMDARGLVADGLTAANLPFGADTQTIAAQMHGRMSGFSASQDGLIFLAEQGGGFAIRNTNDLAGGIGRVLADQNNYYLIGFRPDPSIFEDAKTRFNKLTVRSNLPGLTVRYRSGFFGFEDVRRARTEPSTPQQKILHALRSPFVSGGIGLRLTPLFGNERAGSFVRALVHIPGKELTFTTKPDGLSEAVITIVAYTFGDNGKVLGSAAETHTLTLTDVLHARALTRGLVYSLRVPIKNPGPFQLRLAVRDDKSERIGSASQFMIIPDLKKGRLALSGIALSSYALTKEKNAADEDAATATEKIAGESVLNQAALRRFRANQILQFAYVIYNAKVDKNTQQPRLTVETKLYRDGKQIFSGNRVVYDASGQKDLARLIGESALQLGGLPEGEYVLEIAVTDMLVSEARATTRGWIDFEIGN